MIDHDYMKSTFNSVVEHYSDAVNSVGLWESEKDVISRYLNHNDRILDMGCGAGRVSFGLYNMGYRDVTGVDFSENMIYQALSLNHKMNCNIKFVQGNCLDIDVDSDFYDSAIFSFNGLMQIPGKDARLKAMSELLRVVKPNGYIIFTTQDRNSDKSYLEFWSNEWDKWEKGLMNPSLSEFGDIIFNEENGSLSYIHIPDCKEVLDLVYSAGGELIETFIRSLRFHESIKVREFSSDCRFWVIKNIHNN